MKIIDSPTKSHVAFESKMSTPELSLMPDVTAILQEIYTSLNHLCIRLCAINEGVQEREEAIRKQSLNSGHGGSEARTEEEAIAEYLRLNGIAYVNPDEIGLGHQDSSGPKGSNPYTPIGSITMDLLRAQDKIERLIHIKSPQTTFALESLPTYPRLSDGDSIHGRTDKSTDTNNRLWPKEI